MVFVSKKTLIGIFLALFAAGCSFPVPEETARDLIRVYETPRNLSSEEALAEIRAGTLPAAPPQYNQGLSSNYFWVWVNIENFPNVDNATYIEIDNAHIDTVAAYLVRDSTVVLFGIAGDLIPFSQWPIQVPVPIFELPVLQSGDKILLLIDKQKGNNSFPIHFYSLKEFTFLGIKNTFLYACFFGALGITFLIAFLYGIFNQRKDAIFYSFYVFCMVGFHLTNTGYGFAFIYPDNPEYSTPGRIFFVYFSMAALLIFEYYFLEINKAKIVRYIHLGIMGMILCSIVFNLLSISFLYKIGEPFIRFYFFQNTLVNTWSLVAAFLLRKKAKARSHAFLMGHFGNMLAFFLGVTKDTKLLPVSSFLVDAYITGTIFELLVFNITLIVSIRYINQEQQKLAQSLQKTGKVLARVKKKNKLLVSQLQFQQQQKPAEPVPEETAFPQPYENLALIKVEEHYLHLYTYPVNNTQRTTIRNPLKSFLDQLPPGQFIQTHRSYVVNRNYVQTIGSQYITLQDGTEIPLSRTYKSRWSGANERP